LSFRRFLISTDTHYRYVELYSPFAAAAALSYTRRRLASSDYFPSWMF